MVPVARALREASHEVRFACAQSFRPRIEALGFETFSAGLDWIESEVERFFPQVTKVWLEAGTHLRIVQDVFAGIVAERMVPDLMRIGQGWQPDLVVRNDFEFAGGIAAERLGIPDATVGIEFLMPIQFWRSLIGPEINHLRVTNGLPPQPAPAMLYRYLHLTFIPPAYQIAGNQSVVPVTHFIRATPFDAGVEPGTALLERLNHLPDRPTVYATLGTVFNRTPEVLEMIIEGLAGEPVNLIVTLGPERDPAMFGKLPENVWIERYIPQSLLFPRCDLVITHGGVNTILSALQHGLPLLVVPISAHHPFHAMRVSSLELGKALRRPGQAGLPGDEGWPELSGPALRALVREILESPQYRSKACQIGNEMSNLPGLDHAVHLLERLAEEKAPQLASTSNGTFNAGSAASP
jgi:UDP:flavonoid glycosyltransferase YjiC (YdhE family)